MTFKLERIICTVLLFPGVVMQMWKMDDYHEYDYTVLDTSHRFDECENRCISTLGIGVNMATMNKQLLIDPFVRSVIKTIVWVKCNDRILCQNSSAGYYIQNSLPCISTDKNAVLRCMCQKISDHFENVGVALAMSTSSPKTSPSTVIEATSISRESNWTSIGAVHYFLNQNETTHEQAVKECNNVHGTLVICNHPTVLKALVNSLFLNGMYWIDGRQDSKCLSAIVVDHVEITISNCTLVKQSICSRVTDPDAVKEEPLFLDLIRNMTVDMKDTSKGERRLMSVVDKRLSAKTVGCTLGVSCLLLVTFLFVCADLQRVHMKPKIKKVPMVKRESLA